ncbi:hypothetical protein TSUD_181660 [Trifolium subterraneum]|uniref:Uncharacterized protein n=1 Tax=Trifolium subterraneum TaxID=3900 RepID=A0A2Z6NXZ7_TRISU|nr:hypothetical protein TSUD_181660 [Trifolium subterraneum]
MSPITLFGSDVDIQSPCIFLSVAFVSMEEVEEEGPLASSLTDQINRMKRIAEDLLASGELPEGSRARRDVQEI